MTAKRTKQPQLVPQPAPSPNAEELAHRLLKGKLVGGTVSQMATYADLFLRMPDPVFLLSEEDGTVLEANPAAYSVLQLSPDAILGLPLATWAHRDERKRAEELLKQGHSAELRFTAASGKELRFELMACPVQLADYGRAIQVIARDVTQAHRYRTRLEEINAALEKLSSTDEMTGIRNFRSFKEELGRVHRRCEEEGLSYGVIFIDVDHFKKYNDRNGHPAGDDVLRRVARLLSETARTEDIVARYGGEEFVVLCPRLSPLQTFSMAEQLRAAIQKHPFPHGEHQPLGFVSASIGVAAYPDHGHQSSEVLQNADQALYLSKNGGRNRVTLFGTHPSATQAAPAQAAPLKRAA